MEGGVSPFTADLYSLFSVALKDPESEVQSNAAFAMGSLLFATETDITSEYNNILSALAPLFEISAPGAPTKRENARDNACGAVARMIIKNQDSVPLDQVSYYSF